MTAPIALPEQPIEFIRAALPAEYLARAMNAGFWLQSAGKDSFALDRMNEAHSQFADLAAAMGYTIARKADAKRAGLSGKPGPWQQYPQRMIAHRARAWAIRDGAADALMGMQVAEETSDYGPDHAREINPSTPAAPRRGGVVYAAPEVDEIHDGEVLDPTDSPNPTTDAETEAQIMAELAARDRELTGEM